MTQLLGTMLPTVIAMGVVSETVRRTFPQRGKGTGRATAHWHFKGKTRKAVKHAHPGGYISHRHKGMPGYGRTLKTLRR